MSLLESSSKSRLQKIAACLPLLNFITIHYAYFIVTCLVTSLIFWGASDPGKKIGYTDSLFLVVAAMTEAGLNTVDLSELTTFQQILIFILIIIGSSIFVSVRTVWTRKRVFEKRFKGVVKSFREGRTRMRRRSMSEGGGIFHGGEKGISVGERLEEQMKEREGGDEKVFESRHSGPRDPTHFPSPDPSRGWDLISAPSLAMDANFNQGLSSGAGTGPGDGVFCGESEMVKREEDDGGNAEKQSLEGVRSRNRAANESRTQGTATGTGGGGDPDRISIIRNPSISHRDQDQDQDPSTTIAATPTSPPHRVLNFVGVGSHPRPFTSASASAYSPGTSTLFHRLEKKSEAVPTNLHRDHDVSLDEGTYPSYLTRWTTGRNAQFHGLTRQEREHLGGVEYHAITLLSWVVPVYFVLWQVLGCVGLGTYMKMNKEDVIRANGINPWWLGIFNGVSAFNNSGMSLLDANLIPFRTSVYTLVTMGILVLAGNTAYPLILRLILWLMLKSLTFFYPCPTTYSTHKATLRFILTYPRRVYTTLFPAAATLWLFSMIIILSAIDWLAFEALNIGNAAVDVIPARFRALDGLFQTLSVRSAGFFIIGISELRIGLQVMYVLVMYISVYLVIITMRHSNVYEERSLGIYAEDDSSIFSSDRDDEESRLGAPNLDSNGRPKSHGIAGRFLRTLSTIIPTPYSTKSQKTRAQFVRQQIRGQLAHDIWLVALAVLVIACIEATSFEKDPVTFSAFNIIFEVMSGYGCVGLSTGLKGEMFSFSGGWRKASKFVLIGVMLRGRA